MNNVFKKKYIFKVFFLSLILNLPTYSFADNFIGTAKDLNPINLCGSPLIVGEIAKKFRYQAKHQLHSLSPTDLTAISNIHFVKYESALERNGIRRWYCQGVSHLNDKSHHHIYYTIEKNEPFSAFQTTNVEYCMESFSPWRVYNGFCKSLRKKNLGTKFRVKH